MKDGLFDRPRHSGTIVNNESADIVRMLNSAFAGVVDQGPDFYPEDLAGEIFQVNVMSGVRLAQHYSSASPRQRRSLTFVFMRLQPKPVPSPVPLCGLKAVLLKAFPDRRLTTGVRSNADILTVELGSDAAQMPRLQEVVADHLVRMADKEKLVIEWA